MPAYNKSYLAKIENVIAESDYILRYEKGNFTAGYCLLKEQRIIIINKFYDIEGKVNALLDLIQTNVLDTSKMGDVTHQLYEKILAMDTEHNK